MNNSTLDLIKNILDKKMQMPPGRVWADNVTQDLPQDRDLFIILSFMDTTPYSNTKHYKESKNGLQEVLTVNAAEDIMISLMSASTQARDRRFDVSRALNSDYSQYIQEKYGFHISTIHTIRDSSFLESTARLFRYDVTIRVLRTYEDIQDVDYYDKFPNTSKFEPNWLTEE